ncbi:ABC transporter permease subunit [Kineococcus siccus]|uniref:ABC transporter permease subunit n=1 Tax=Kineococcus siccus TaxID=2696567 RepID=UPI00196B0196
MTSQTRPPVTPVRASGTAADRTSGVRRHSPTGRAVTYVLLVVALLVTLLPFAWMVLGSFKTQAELTADPNGFLPDAPTFANYRQWLVDLDIGRFFGNTLLVAVVTVAGNLVFCSMVGYALAKMEFAGKRVLLALVLGMLMIPSTVTFIPLFVTVSRLGLVNSYGGLILPFLANAIGVFLMRQFMSDIPDSLIEAARIDGAGEFRIFSRIVLPLCGPALATLAILTFLFSWNNFLWPLVVAQNEDRFTLPVAISLYSTGQNASNYGLLLAGAVLVVTPIVLLFLALQRYFIQGIASTGIK